MLTRFAIATCLALMSLIPLSAADDLLERLATCKDSWYEGRENPAAMKNLADTFNKAFKEDDRRRGFIPKGSVTVAGLPVVQAYPQSAGMGVGFVLSCVRVYFLA